MPRELYMTPVGTATVLLLSHLELCCDRLQAAAPVRRGADAAEAPQLVPNLHARGAGRAVRADVIHHRERP